MPYIGRGPAKSGAFRILDDVSGDFNGSTVTFALTVASTALTVGLPETLIIAVDGVIQEPGSAYTISGSNIVFGSAPQEAATFWGVELGDVGGLADRATTQSASNDSTKVATTAYVDNQIDVQLTAEDLDVTGDSGTIAIDLDSEALAITGGAGITTTASGNAVDIVGHVEAHTVASHSDTTATGAELNLLDGVSGLVQADFTKLAAIDSTATELNLLDALDRGSILYGNPSGVTTVLGQGTTDQVLTSDGADIAWQDAAAGGIASVVADTTPQVGGSAGFDLQAQLLVGNGGTTGIAISANGEVTMAAQPAVLALNTSTRGNVTGAGTEYTVIFDTEIYDQNGDFDGTSTFTAPVTGKYLIFFSLTTADGWTAAMVHYETRMASSNRFYDEHSTGYPLIDNSGALRTVMGSLVDMDASDTVTMVATVDSGASNTVDILGNATYARTSIQVCLLV